MLLILNGIVEPHARLGQQAGVDFHRLSLRQNLVQLLQLFPSRPALTASRQVLIASCNLIRGKLPVNEQRQTLFHARAIHLEVLSHQFQVIRGVVWRGGDYAKSPNSNRSFCVARERQFLAVCSVVLHISPITLSFNPW